MQQLGTLGRDITCAATTRLALTSRTPDCCRAHVVADHSEQGWCRLCNGIILFDDGHYLTPPDGHDQLISA